MRYLQQRQNQEEIVTEAKNVIERGVFSLADGSRIDTVTHAHRGADPNAADSTSDRGTSAGILVEPGWQVFSRDGVLLGQVISANAWYLHIRTGDGDRSIELRADTLVEQEVPEQRVRISVDAVAMARG